ncbi:hypothetical protein [uncultured Tateyamaria sp.]|uniref:hypothetical protein n=1 Tax=uncultured Tateyamaria sp. TaxID=455651 RepID=UPI002607CB28|nr:hypothetical protein [uncultured Tateyamaria sp.]
MARLKVLALAVATGRIGYAFFDGKELKDWGGSAKASQSRKRAIKQAERWIDCMRPDVVVTEDVKQACRKGARSKRLIAALADLSNNLPLMDVSVRRNQSFSNKYDEAKALAVRYPTLLPWIPRRPRIWEHEPYRMIYFEAVALALGMMEPPNEPAH